MRPKTVYVSIGGDNGAGTNEIRIIPRFDGWPMNQWTKRRTVYEFKSFKPLSWYKRRTYNRAINRYFMLQKVKPPAVDAV